MIHELTYCISLFLKDYLQGNALKKSEEEKKLMKLKGAVKMKRKIPQNRSLFTTL